MTPYLFALTPAATLVTAPAASPSAPYRCPGCGEPLVLVPATQAIAAHFAHPPLGCDRAAYLHNSARQAFKQAFDFHSKHGGYHVRTSAGDRLCISHVFAACALDATATDGGPTPDVTLLSRPGDYRRLFVELAVSAPTPWHSIAMRYYPTIEIAIPDEAAILALRADTLDLGAPGVTFYDNAVDVAAFLVAPLYLTPRQREYVARLDWPALDAAEPFPPSLQCALLELGALRQDGRADRGRLAEIRAVYGEGR
jgi:hypothetical protein